MRTLKTAPVALLFAALAFANWNAHDVRAYEFRQIRWTHSPIRTFVATAAHTDVPFLPPPPAATTPAARPTVAAGGAAAAAQAAPGHPTRNWLTSEDGRISVYVGVYDDPTGQSAVPHGYAVLDLAMREVPWYFDGHNPGVFTPLLSEGAGSVMDYWDGGGKLHRLRIVSVRSWQRLAGEPPPVSSAVVAQFQTCRTLDGSVDWIYDAVAV